MTPGTLGSRGGPRVLAGVTQMLLRTAAGEGLDRAALLSAAGLTEDQLADRDAYIDLDAHLALADEMVRHRPGVNLGLRALQHLSPATMGVLGYVIANNTDLRGALADFTRFQHLVTDTVDWRLTIHDQAIIEVVAHPRLSRLGHPIETMVGAWVALGRALTGVSWTPRSLQYQHAPLGDPAEHERFFGVPVAFEAPVNALCLDAAVLAFQVRGARPALRVPLMQHAEARLHADAGTPPVAERLRTALSELVPAGDASQRAAARRLGLSERTLSRRLHGERTSFGAILDQVRRDLALGWLDDPSLAVYEIAFLLGYSEPSTFHRAFKRWTGTTPHAYRRARGCEPVA